MSTNTRLRKDGRPYRKWKNNDRRRLLIKDEIMTRLEFNSIVEIDEDNGGEDNGDDTTSVDMSYLYTSLRNALGDKYRSYKPPITGKQMAGTANWTELMTWACQRPELAHIHKELNSTLPDKKSEGYAKALERREFLERALDDLMQDRARKLKETIKTEQAMAKAQRQVILNKHAEAEPTEASQALIQLNLPPPPEARRTVSDVPAAKTLEPLLQGADLTAVARHK